LLNVIDFETFFVCDRKQVGFYQNIYLSFDARLFVILITHAEDFVEKDLGKGKRQLRFNDHHLRIAVVAIKALANMGPRGKSESFIKSEKRLLKDDRLWVDFCQILVLIWTTDLRTATEKTRKIKKI